MRNARGTRFAASLSISTVLAVGAGVLMSAPAMAADAVLQLDKSSTTSIVAPGDDVPYELELTCSSLVQGCIDATITDVLPAEFEVSSLPTSTSEREVTYDAATRKLTVKFRAPLSNPSGSFGLPAGQNRKIALGLRLPADSPIADGATITNTAEATATNADQVTDSVDITADVPVNYNPAATKAFSEDSALAGTGAQVTATLGVRNGSSSASQVKQLQVEDTTQATFDVFDVTQLGPLKSFPPGTDQVIVSVCTEPIGTPCSEGAWVSSAPLSDNGPYLPPWGSDLSIVTGVKFTFLSSTGADIPTSKTQGLVDLGLKLRDTYRSTGADIDPVTTVKITNQALPVAVDGSGTKYPGTPAKDTFEILPDTVVVDANKKMYPDANGSYTQNGAIVTDQSSGISMNLTATNRGAPPLSTLSIQEPSATTANEFSKIDVTTGRFTWPAGATVAELSVECRNGKLYSTNFTKSSTYQNISTFGCDAGDFPATVKLEYSSGTDPLMLTKDSGMLQLHGKATGATTADVSDNLDNSVDVEGTNPSSTGAAQTTASVPVEGIRTGGTFDKTSYKVSTIAAGQPMAFALSYSNTGNVPATNVVISDPIDPTATDGSNPFAQVADGGVIRVHSFKQSTTDPASVLEVYDPTVSNFVPYVSTDAALLKRSTGARVRLTEPLDPGETFRVTLNVVARDNPEPAIGATFKNCAQVTHDGLATPKTDCINTITYGIPDAAASLQKDIVPSTVVRPEPGLPAQKMSVKHRLQNSGNMNLSRLQFTDVDSDFFDAVTFTGTMVANMPPGANRVQVDVCTTDCATPTWINGSPSASPKLPTGVTAADVKGIRVTYTTSTGGYQILPVKDWYPSTGNCKSAAFCFDVTARATLASDPNQPIPSSVTDTSNGAAESKLQTPGQSFAIPPDDSTFNVVKGTPILKITKGPDSRIGPGDTAPFDIVIENTGTTAITEPTILDPLPPELTLVSSIPGAQPGEPYVLKYLNLPSGYSSPTTVNFTATPDSGDPNRTAAVQWSFPGWNLPPGGKITVRIEVELTPGTPADVDVENKAGARGANPDLQCQSGSFDTGFESGDLCTDTAEIRSLPGNALKAYKWSAGDQTLGFYKTTTQSIVGFDDPTCPKYSFEGKQYTHYPCAAIVMPGTQIDYLIRYVNAGTNDLTRVVIVDGLPVEGDTGVLLSRQNRSTAWSERPVMASEVTSVEGYPGFVASYTDNKFPGPDFCMSQLTGGSCPTDAFDADFGSSNTGFRVEMDYPSGEYLAPGESANLTFTMDAPLTLGTAEPMPAEWNSFGIDPSFTVGGLSPSEPLKAGAVMPFGKVTVTKEVIGLPDGIAVDPFDMAYKCEVGGTEVDSGTFTVTEGSEHVLPLQPAGAECSVWETDSQGASTDYLGEENAAKVVVESLIDNPAGLTVDVANSYVGGQISVTKKTSGAAADVKTASGDKISDAAYPIRVICEFPAGGDVLPDFPAERELKSGETVVIDLENGERLPANSNCTVVELDAGGASKTEFTIDESPSTSGTDSEAFTVKSKEDGGNEVEINNVYEGGIILLNKTLSGDASQFASGRYEFSVQCKLGETDLEEQTAELTPQSLEAEIGPLPVGAVCEVSETSAGDSSTTPGLVTTVTIPSATAAPCGDKRKDGLGCVEVDADNEFPAGTLSLSKVTDGAASALVTSAQFTLEAVCTKDGTEVLRKSVTLGGGDTVPLTEPIPMGSKCWATETDAGGATSSSIDFTQGSPAVIDDSTPTATITATNTFEAAGLRVRKNVRGTAPVGAEYLFDLTCTVGGVTADIPGSKFALPAGGTASFVVPVGSDCKVKETNSRGALRVEYSGDGTNGRVTVKDESIVTVLNVYEPKKCEVTIKGRSAKTIKRNGRTVLVSSVQTQPGCKLRPEGRRVPGDGDEFVPPTDPKGGTPDNPYVPGRPSTYDPKHPPAGYALSCAPAARSAARGQLRYCSARVSKSGKLVVVTNGFARIRVSATFTAVPKKGREAEFAANSVRRKWRTL